MAQRPEVISKLAMFLLDKEPLLYLFIINSDFIPVENFFQKTHGLAGVTFKNKRINFEYDPIIFEKFSVEEVFWLVLHESFHIFKKHLETYKDFKCNPMLLNLAMDGIINEEIAITNFSYNLKPTKIKGTALIPKEFKTEFAYLDKDAFTSKRLYYWYLEKAKQQMEEMKKSLLKPGKYVKIDEDSGGEYGQIEAVDKGNYTVNRMSKDEMIDEVSTGKKIRGKKENFESKNLTPVVFGEDAYHGEGVDEQTIINPQELDSSEEEKIDAEIFTKKMVQQAKEIEKTIPQTAGSEIGNFTKAIEKLLKPKVNWKKVLNRHLNLFFSRNSNKKDIKKSFITYPWNAKSRYGILYKHTIETIAKKQSYIILAVDTSGSIFGSPEELETFFTEIEEMAKWLNFTKTGAILTVQWDSQIQEGLAEYKTKDWKKFGTGKKDIKGGGGTTPEVVFNYLTKIFKKQDNVYHIKENGIDFIIENEKKLPYLIFLTDGQFFHKLFPKNLGIYEANKENILFFTRSKECLYKDAEHIIYE
jgi:predicted metal-dependent peptidase